MPKETAPANERLPDEAQDTNYVRHFFNRLDINNRKVSVLMGSDALRKIHKSTTSNTFSNEFFATLLNEDWKLETNETCKEKRYDSPRNYMILCNDTALIRAPK